mgnify:CR=1 FL=1
MTDKTLKKLNIIGAGRVGQALGRLWREAGIFTIGGIVNRTPESARKAAAFIGAGAPVESIAALPAADLTMIATPDDEIALCVSALRKNNNLQNQIVFHCSGALPSSLLLPASETGAFIASVHPVKSIADASDCVKTFAGTWCGVEGDAQALAVLEDALQKCSAKTFPVNPVQKTLYHTANVFICNYLTALMDVGLDCYERAGVPRETAIEITRPMIAETIRNIQTRGTAAALTGPIARGDMKTVEKQMQALRAWNPDYAALYEQLGKVATVLAQEQRMAA